MYVQLSARAGEGKGSSMAGKYFLEKRWKRRINSAQTRGKTVRVHVFDAE